jgi:uncharacterized protein YdaU (DUF1376 family)
MPVYAGDYLAKTAHLSTVEHGAYLLLMLHYWINGRLPKSEDAIRRITRMTPRQWARSRDQLRSLFGDDWRHMELDERLQQAIEKSKVNSANARLSHANRKKSAPEPEQQSHTESELEPEAKSEVAQKEQQQSS